MEGQWKRLSDVLAEMGIEDEEWNLSPKRQGEGRLEILRDTAYRAFAARLSQGRDWLPDLIYFTDDHLATGAFAVLPSHGIRIPEDVKVVSWANAGYGPVFRTSVARMEMDPLADGDVVASRAIEYLESRRRIDGAFLEPAYVEGATFPCNNRQKRKTQP